MDEHSLENKSWILKLVTVIAVSFSLFHLYTGGFGSLPAMQQRLVHITLGMMMVFLVYPLIKGKKNVLTTVADAIIFLASVAVGGYLLFNSDAISFRLGDATDIDILVGSVLVILVLEGTRRLLGWPLPVVAGLSLAYAYFGDKLFGQISHTGFDTTRIVSHLSLTTEGIFGIPLGASASIVAIFIIFAAFLNGTGVGEYFVDLVMGLFGRTRGGAAKAAVVGSGLMGMLTGSVIANVMSIGTFTVPLMKKTGYSARVAGAIEAVSSTGGQIMPPVMGAAAYIIAEVLRLPFVEIIKAAAIPAVLYYLAEFVFVDLEADKLGLRGLPKEELAPYRERARGKGYLVLPIIVLLVLMIALDWSPQRSVFFAIVLAFIIGILKNRNRLNPAGILDILDKGARGTLEVVMATACAGIIIGVMSLTGLGIQLSTILVGLAGGNLILLLVLTMIVSLILGMGMTTTACYVILAVLVAPALVKMGVLPIAAHFFVFFFGMYSFITPPVALGAYAAASLAGSEPFSTGYLAWKIALPGFILPYIFVFSPALLGYGAPVEVISAIVSACIGVWFLSMATAGYFVRMLRVPERVVLLISGILLIIPGFKTDLAGMVMGILVAGYVYRTGKKIQTGVQS